jgi:hypothetical protein
MYLRYVLSAAAIFCLAGAAKADYSLQFDNSVGVPTNAFTINGVGNSVTVQLYLVKTNTGSSNTLTTVGLSEGGVALNFAAANFSVGMPVANSAQFPYFSTNVGPGTTSVSDATGTPVIAPTVGINASRILLGTFTFTATTGTGGTITTSFPGAGANDVNGSGQTLDSLVSQSSASILVITVPEPGSMILSGLAGSLIAVGAWRKRRRTLASQVA